MPLPRLHLFELEDQPWFPRTLRNLTGDYLQFIETKFALHKPVVPLLLDALRQSNATAIVDLCSGGGGPALAVYESLTACGVSVPFTLTDKYPNLPAFRRLSLLHPGGLTHCTDSVDAAKVPQQLLGFRTMFNAFHHFAPAQARSVLACAVAARQPIGIFEIPDRRMAAIVPLSLTPLYVAIATPFIRPFQWRRLLWTYVLPLVPLTCWWDGLISQLRAYTAAEMLELARGLGGYEWRAERVRIRGSAGNLTYLLGIPTTVDIPQP